MVTVVQKTVFIVGSLLPLTRCLFAYKPMFKGRAQGAQVGEQEVRQEGEAAKSRLRNSGWCEPLRELGCSCISP